MSTPPPNKDDRSSPPNWLQAPTELSQSPSVPSPMSVPSLALWSRKIALQSEGLAALVQSSSAKLLSHQEQLQDILNSCKAEIAGAKEEIEASTKQRDDNVDTHLTTIRRLTQTISDVINALEAKLSVLDTLHTLHRKLQSHDLLFRELTTGQKQLLQGQEKLSAVQETMVAKQKSQMKDILRTLDRIEKGQVRIPQTQELARSHEVAVVLPITREEITIKDSQPQLVLPKFKRQRRLLSDDEVLEEFSSGSGYRQLSMELLPFEEIRQIKEATVVERSERVIDAGGVMSSDRPLKRKLLSTIDLEQFAADDF